MFARVHMQGIEDLNYWDDDGNRKERADAMAGVRGCRMRLDSM